MADVSKSVSALSDAVTLLNTETDSLIVKFGQMSESSKIWTIASRVLSGSGLWKLQNRIRAVGQTINVFNTMNNEALESQIKATEATRKMGKALVELQKESEIAKDSEYARLQVQEMVNQGIDDTIAKKRVEAKIEKQYDDTISALKKKMGRGAKVSKASEFLKSGSVRGVDAEGKMGKFEKRKGFGQFTKNEVISAFNKMKFAGAAVKQIKWSQIRQKLTAKVIKSWGKIKKLVDIGLSFLMKFMMYLLLATLVIMLLRKAWPLFKDALEYVGGLKQDLAMAFSGVMDIFKGIWKILQGVFEGNFSKVFSGLKQLGMGILKVLIASLKMMVKIVVAILIALPLKLARMIGEKISGALPSVPGYSKMKKIVGFASGGVSSGGLAVVGEQGPELVNLPAGTRVHSNAASRKMGGSTIHVHVNGRVGASDSEIRDIANKVAREINLRMNRTSSSVSGF